MKIALAQIQMSDDKKENLKKSLSCLKEASENGADLIVYPELQLTKFFPQYPGMDVKNQSITQEDSVLQIFCDACREHHIMIVPNVYLEENGHFYDTSFLIDKQGKILGCQKMVHIAQAVQFYEQDYYEPSDEGFQVFETEFGKIGIVVCFDRHYPESIRTETLKGADLILIPTANTRTEPLEMFEWEVRVQAFQNSVAIVMCNRVGTEDEMNFAGESLAVDANGNLLVKADDKERLVYADIYLPESRTIRSAKSYTALRTREFYK